jgi:glycosyltransferase involved in cell wall biosynthesis
MPSPLCLPEVLPFQRASRARLGAGARALVVLHEPDDVTWADLRLNVPELVRAGYRCTFLAPEAIMPALRDTLASVVGRDLVASPSGSDLWRAVRAQLQTRPFGLLHAHGRSAAAHAWLGGLGLSVPLVVTLHESPRAGQFPGLVGQAKRWLLGRVLARAAAVVAVSEECKASLLRLFPNLRRLRERAHAVRMGVDTRRFEGRLVGPASRAGPGADAARLAAPTTLRCELGLKDGTTLIGYLGDLSLHRGFELLLEAVARLVRHGGVAPFHVIAFGAGDGAKRSIEQKWLRDHLTLHPSVPDPAAALGQLDLLVAPGPGEAAALTCMEALCAGVPVLGADWPELREVLDDTPAGTVRAGAVAALETGLREALARPWTTAARAFAAEARQRFDNRLSARRLVELLDRVAAPGAA